MSTLMSPQSNPNISPAGPLISEVYNGGDHTTTDRYDLRKGGVQGGVQGQGN